MELEKLINTNPNFDTIIGGTIAEYDIRSAGATAIKQIKGDDVYNYLMSLEKEVRNIKIGLMMRDEKGLSEKVNKLMLDWLNLFIKENKIKPQHFISTTRDSIFIYNKLPTKTKFGDVEFRNKDGIFSSMYRIKRITIFYDSMRDLTIVKGISDKIVEESPFLHQFLNKYLRSFEMCQKSGDQKMFSNLKHLRDSYLTHHDKNIYRDLLSENMYCVVFGNEVMYVANDFSQSDDTDFVIARDANYINVVLPIMRSVMLNG